MWFDAAADAAHALGRQQCRAAAEKGIEDEVATGRTIEDRIGNQRDRLYGRVPGRKILFLSLSPEMVRARVMPNVAAVAAVLSELNVVPVRRPAVLEQVDQLALAPIQRAHAGVVLDPNAQIFELGINPQRRSQQLVLMAPIHADVMQRAGRAVSNEELQRRAEKARELGRSHLPGRHRKFSVAHLPFARNMTIDRDVVLRIRKDYSRRGT